MTTTQIEQSDSAGADRSAGKKSGSGRSCAKRWAARAAI